MAGEASHKGQDLATRSIHVGSPDREPGTPVVNPVVQSATFHWSGPGDGVELAYSRYGNNPNQIALAQKVAALEGKEAALALSSGMAATAMTMLSLTNSGSHVVASQHLYGATRGLLANELPKRGVTTTFVDPFDDTSWADALTADTRVVFIELPTNPTLRVFDPAAARHAASQAGAVLVADATFASPANITLDDHGVDLVIHSATKYLGGHSDLIAGVVAGSADLIAGVTDMMRLYGPAIDPHTAWLLDRGIRTLVPRMEAHNRNAMALATWLADRPEVSTVIYPGLESHPDHALASRMLRGYGGMVSMILEGGGPAADAFASALSLAMSAPSLGGVETLVSQPRHTSHVGLSAEERAAMGIPDGFVRISVGLEGQEDLRADFARALAAA